MTQRIVVVGGPWPERHGAEGIIAEPSPERARKYPFTGCGPNEVVVLLDDDPLSALNRAPWRDPLWTCVIGRNDIRFLP